MSTIVVVRKGNIACIAADTLTVYGAQLDHADSVANSNKIVKVGQSYIGLVGPASSQSIFVDYFSRFKRKPAFKDVQDTFRVFRKMFGVLKSDYFINPNIDGTDEIESMHMQCLIVNAYGIFGVYPSRAVVEFEKFYAFGDGDEYAQGAMHAIYKTKASAEAIAHMGIETASKLNQNTGMPMTSFTVKLRKKKTRGDNIFIAK